MLNIVYQRREEDELRLLSNPYKLFLFRRYVFFLGFTAEYFD
ncbi:hypothetical protein BREVNS_0381 [Brevinematales bacterium NS]|nr:hypothetical protein BREVNS_0381 [Brevinematales bacterium NS]